MIERRKPRPRDPLQLGKLIVDIATGQVEGKEDDGKDSAAVELGPRGDLKGGKARAASDVARDPCHGGWRDGQAVGTQ
jgi:hypothetical protein